jgi:hypothetical protein
MWKVTLEPAKLLVNFFKKVPAHIDKKGRNFRFFYRDAGFATKVHTLLPVNNEIGGFCALEPDLQGAVTTDEVRS